MLYRQLPAKDEKSVLCVSIELVRIVLPDEKTLIENINPESFKFAALRSPNPMVLMSDAETPLFVNPGFEKMFGYVLEDIVPVKKWFKKAYPDTEYRVMAEEEWYKTYNRSKEDFPVIREFRVSAKDGTIRDIIFRVYKENGYCVVFFEDVTAQRRAELELRKSEQKYRELVNSANDAIFVADAETGIILDVNRQGEILLGRSKNEIIGMQQARLHPEDERDRYKQIFREHGRQINRIADGLYVQHSNGQKIPVEISASVTQLEGRRIVQGIFRDITERKKREEEHLKIMKLESIEMLAGGIAHDLNNILTAIMGNLTLARMNVDRESQAWPMLNDAEQASIRANDLTRQLLTFSHEGVLSTRPSSLEELVRDSTIFVLRGSSISCTFDFQNGLWSIEADRVQFSQVIQNLVINAKQSMPDGGTIEIHACNRVIEDMDIDVLKPGKYVVFSISDQGCGISEENLLRIFDPYFTTRESGTGLGLSIAYSIIQRHGGTMHVSSVEGEGTTFQIYIPASFTNVENHEKDESHVTSGSGRILVMDDEQMVRQIVSDMLEHLGYEVRTASDGKEAVQLYSELYKDGECYDAVLVDLTVQGGMGGLEALRKIRQIDENARVIVASGYSNDNVMVKFSDYGFVGKIEKPFIIEHLGSLLKNVIDN